MGTNNLSPSPQSNVPLPTSDPVSLLAKANRTRLLGLARWQLAVILGVAAYVFVATLLFGVAFRYLCLGAILMGLAASRRADAKRFLRDWLPLLLFWVGYDWMRDFADEVMPRVAVAGPYLLSSKLFGWLTGGVPPAIHCMTVLAESPGRYLVQGVAQILYWSHLVVIPGYLLHIWWNPPTTVRFQRFMIGITLLSTLALATYFIYPAAPPWYVFYFGFQQPSPELLSNPAFLPTPVFFKSFWAANPNWFAAIPSLHGAYPVFLVLMLDARSGRRLALNYCLAVWLSTVVLGHHYIIDLILGALYAWVSAWIVSYYHGKTSQADAAVNDKPAKESIAA